MRSGSWSYEVLSKSSTHEASSKVEHKVFAGKAHFLELISIHHGSALLAATYRIRSFLFEIEALGFALDFPAEDFRPE